MHTFLIITHIIGTSLGVGGATISDFLFFRILRNKKIESGEFTLIKTVSSVVWLGFIILVFSGLGFLILYRLNPQWTGLIYNPKLFAKLTIVVIILFNGLIMHWKVFPRLESGLEKSLVSITFTTGAVSIASWYSALILGAWRGLDLSYLTIMAIYLILVFFAVIIANSMGSYYKRNFYKK